VKYPAVLSEAKTMALVAAGASIARFGDGEFNLCRGGRAKAQSHQPEIGRRLREILADAGQCLVGIPNIHSDTPKADFWQKYRGFPHLGQRSYVSSFITRPDSAPWIDTPTYWAQVHSLWVDHRVTLVRGSGRSLTAEDLWGAASVTEVIGPPEEAWENYHGLITAVLATRPTRVLLCLGPTATVMAVDLAAMGIHAVDLGHLGRFLRRHRKGEDVTSPAKDAA
jgi:hypothetical protein